MLELKNIFITTTLPYVNSVPHIGHALEMIQGDTIARYLKNIHGIKNVKFSTGLDEHGLKVYTTAKEKGIDTQEYCDSLAVIWQDFLAKFYVKPDTFYRTTSESHKFAVQEAWRRCLKQGDIYQKEYTGFYCVGCESFKTSKDLVDGKCTDHPHLEVNEVKENNYFFRLSKYKNELLDWVNSSPDFLTPSSKTEELKNLILDCEDISISRLKTTVPWGIEVPNDPEQNIYVWFEALCNYIASAGWNTLNEYWRPGGIPGYHSAFKGWDKSIQLCGPDNLRFQAVIWQGILKSLDINHTKTLLVHGTVVDENGAKMSKSVGNVVDPIEQLNKYGITAVRYYIIAGLPTYANCSWKEDDLINLYNAHLANNFGNLVNRVNTLLLKNNVVIDLGNFDIDSKFVLDVKEKMTTIHSLLSKYELKLAFTELSGICSLANEWINQTQPWKEKNDESDNVLISIHWAFISMIPLYSIVIPDKEDEMIDVVFNLKKQVLFPRLEKK